ncbi:MAG: hsp70 nucleotide exchange factor fes1 [Trizodia sp. TS-e1964]|nr:MAG: hsp70 nucleotide exchange factor fes1 [Trizodia sp. TS-e1964]
MNPGMNSLLKWSVENSAAREPGQAPPSHSGGLNTEILAALMGGPSDADLMRESMAAILSPEVDLANKLVAFDNFEQLIEQIDNANNLAPLALWPPLIGMLDSPEAELRRMAAWCVGTAVQNNPKAQEKALELNAIPKLVAITMSDPSLPVRQKAIYALSSEVRNYQPGLDRALEELPSQYGGRQTLDAGDMEPIDKIMALLRQSIKVGVTNGIA